MALPRKLKFMNLFFNGDNWVGQAEQFTSASLTRKMEVYRGGGMPGSAKTDMGFDDDALDTSCILGGYEADILRNSASATHDAVMLRFAGSFQQDDTGEVTAVEIVQRGRIQEIDRGDYKTGEESNTTVNFVNTYYKEVVNGETVVEIDTVNMIHIVDGVDMLEEHRRAIGL